MAPRLPPAAPALLALILAACRGGDISSLLGGPGTTAPATNSNSRPSVPGEPNTASPQSPNAQVSPRVTQFRQGLLRGQDPRLVLRDGNYFFTNFLGANLTLYKSPSMVDLGAGKSVAATLGQALGSPIFVDKVGGQAVGAWFLFGSTALFVNTMDPYDNADQWRMAATMPWTDLGADPSQVPFDFEIFQNPQAGPYQNRWYLVWARADTQTGAYVEHIYASEVSALSTTSITLSQTASTAANRIVSARGGSDWAANIVEAPGVAINGQSVSLAYSGNGADLTLYALGLATLKAGADPTQAASWIDISHGECDGSPVSGPAFAKSSAVTGPGVARFVKSRDGSEDWMMYDAKMFDTFDPALATPEASQTHNEEWSRYIAIQKISWRALTCSGQPYQVPALGQPLPPGQLQNLPAGDPGPQARGGPFRIEAEAMLSFGTVMGPSVQGLTAPKQDTMVLAVTCAACSSGYMQTNLPQLAADSTTSPKTSGLIFSNSPPASSLALAHANVAAGSLDLYLNGKLAQSLQLPATGDAATFRTDAFAQAIAAGDELRLVWQDGKSIAAVNLDYLELTP